MYHQIVNTNFCFDRAALTDSSLRGYFDGCFNDAVEIMRLYPAWACMDCAELDGTAVWLGLKPDRCTRCEGDRVFEVATFQARGPVVGDVFQEAFHVLIRRLFQINLTVTLKEKKTHDLEVSSKVVIEAKGSPVAVKLSNGLILNLPRAGMLRSDTRKKVYANAKEFKSSNPDGTFLLVSNTLPTSSNWFRSDDVDGFYEVTKRRDLEEFVRDIQDLTNPPLPRRR